MKFAVSLIAAACVGMSCKVLYALPMPLVNVKTFSQKDFEQRSPYVLDLAGEWRYRWSGSEDRAPVGFQARGYDVSRWEKIQVPSCPEALGWGSSFVPCRSVSCYRRTFSLPPVWDGRRKYLELSGARGACTVWINGQELTAATNGVYDVTAAVSAAALNEIAVRVVRGEGEAWSGLCGKVRLFSAANVELADFRVKVTPDADYLSAEIEVEADVVKRSSGVSVLGVRGVANCVAKVFDERGLEVAASPVEQIRLSDGATTTVRQKLTVDAPRFWSAERPYSYVVAVQVDGDLRAKRVPFRDARQRDRAVLRAARVSAADFPGGGGASANEIAACLARLKRGNFNAVVDGGDLPYLFGEICDQYGLYVFTEMAAEVPTYASLGPEGAAAFEEAKHANSPLTVVCANAATGRAVLRNAHTAIAASEYLARWSIVRDGAVVSEGTFDPPPIPGGERGLLELPMPAADGLGPTSRPGEYFYNLSFVRRMASPGVAAGHEVVRLQIPYAAVGASETVAAVSPGKVRIGPSADAKFIEVNAGRTRAVFDCLSRRLRSLEMDGRAIFADGAGLEVFADGLAGVRTRPGELRAESDAVVVTDEVLTESSAGYDRTVRWSFAADGKVGVEVSLAPFGRHAGELGAVGLEWRLPEVAGRKFSYVGRGPWANRPEACAAAAVGLYAGTGAELAGFRSGVRRFAVSGAGGAGVEIVSPVPFCLEIGESVRMHLAGEHPLFQPEKWSVAIAPLGIPAARPEKEREKDGSGWLFW